MASILHIQNGWRALVRIRSFSKARTFATKEEATAWAAGVEDTVLTLVLERPKTATVATHSLHIADQIRQKNEILGAINIAPRDVLEREFRRWRMMHSRCYRQDAPNYHLYGGRGIKVCERWHNFASYLQDMGIPPADGLSLDRRNNDGDYSPENCRWATQAEQCGNKRHRSNMPRNAIGLRPRSSKTATLEWDRLMQSSQFIRDLDAILTAAAE
jgi:hypothetical protein